MLEIDLSHRFPGFALEVAFTAPPGVTALFGASGSGKTSVVAAVAGLLRPDRARIVLDGRVLCDTGHRVWLPPHRRGAGYVFQEGRLFPHLDVRANLTYGRPRSAPAEGFGQVVEMLGIGALLDRRPATLSGGEKARVAIGRALLSAPRMLLLDEPLAALDGPRKDEILPYLERLRDETRVPLLYVSHAVTEVARLATHVVVLHAGRVRAQGTAAEVLADPASLSAGGPQTAGALLTARVAQHHDDGLTELAHPGGRIFLPRVAAAPGAALRVRIAAQDVVLSTGSLDGLSALTRFTGRVIEIVPGPGPGALVRIDIAGETLLARLTKRSVQALALAPGSIVQAAVKTVAVARADVGLGGPR